MVCESRKLKRREVVPGLALAGVELIVLTLGLPIINLLLMEYKQRIGTVQFIYCIVVYIYICFPVS